MNSIEIVGRDRTQTFYLNAYRNPTSIQESDSGFFCCYGLCDVFQAFHLDIADFKTSQPQTAERFGKYGIYSH